MGYILLNAASAPRANWFMSLIPDRTRGEFTAIYEENRKEGRSEQATNSIPTITKTLLMTA